MNLDTVTRSSTVLLMRRIEVPTLEVDLSDGDVNDVNFALESVPAPMGSLGSLGQFSSSSLFGSLGSTD